MIFWGLRKVLVSEAGTLAIFYARVLLIGLLFGASVFAQAASTDRSSNNGEYVSLIDAVRFQAPIDFCGEMVPLDITEVRERFEKEMLLTLNDRPQIILWLKRSSRFMPLIQRELAANGLPEDLKYIAIAESALRPHAGSRAGAVGFWQFMKATGRRFGLAVNAEIDERRSIYKSTRAAIDYLSYLYEVFNSWTLAAAAYNMGEEGLESEILLQEVSDYYRLYLPLETQRYIPRIITAKLILMNPEKYGFSLAHGDSYAPYETDEVVLHLKQRTPIRLVATAAGTYFKQIKDLNPDIRGHYLAAGSHSILIPKGAAGSFKNRLDAAVTDWQRRAGKIVYTVKAGDNLSGIANRFQVPLQALLIWNDINARHNIHPGDQLIVYDGSAAGKKAGRDQSKSVDR